MTHRRGVAAAALFGCWFSALSLALWLNGLLPENLRLRFIVVAAFGAGSALALWHRRRREVAVAVTSATVALVAGDLALRLLLAEQPYRPHERFVRRYPDYPLLERYEPDVRFHGETHGDLATHSARARYRERRRVTFSTDSFGVRSSPGSPEGPFDLIALGDSFGTGEGSSEEAGWLWRLAADRHLRCYNLSMPGYSPWQSYLALRLAAPRLPLQPGATLLLALFSGNDLDEVYGPLDPTLARGSLVQRLRLELDRHRGASAVRGLLLDLLTPERSGLLSRPFPDRGVMLFYGPYAERRHRSEAALRSHPHWAAFVETLEACRRFSTQSALRLAIVLIPSKEEVYGWVLDGAPAWSTRARPTPLGGLLATLCSRENIAFLDLMPALVDESRRAYEASGELLWWRDDTHWSPAGHRFAAELIGSRFFPSRPAHPRSGRAPLLPGSRRSLAAATGGSRPARRPTRRRRDPNRW